MEMTEQGKALLEVTLTITESTPSGNSYLKYWGQSRGECGEPSFLRMWVLTPRRGLEGSQVVESLGEKGLGQSSPISGTPRPSEAVSVVPGLCAVPDHLSSP